MKVVKSLAIVCIALLGVVMTSAFKSGAKKEAGAFLEITLKVNDADRASAAGVYLKYKQPFLTKIKGSVSKELLIRTDDVQVLHGFETVADAEAYLKSDLFNNDVVTALKPYLQAGPEIRIYSVFTNKK